MTKPAESPVDRDPENLLDGYWIVVFNGGAVKAYKTRGPALNSIGSRIGRFVLLTYINGERVEVWREDRLYHFENSQCDICLSTMKQGAEAYHKRTGGRWHQAGRRWQRLPNGKIAEPLVRETVCQDCW